MALHACNWGSEFIISLLSIRPQNVQCIKNRCNPLRHYKHMNKCGIYHAFNINNFYLSVITVKINSIPGHRVLYSNLLTMYTQFPLL